MEKYIQSIQAIICLNKETLAVPLLYKFLKFNIITFLLKEINSQCKIHLNNRNSWQIVKNNQTVRVARLSKKSERRSFTNNLTFSQDRTSAPTIILK